MGRKSKIDVSGLLVKLVLWVAFFTSFVLATYFVGTTFSQIGVTKGEQLLWGFIGFFIQAFQIVCLVRWRDNRKDVLSLIFYIFITFFNVISCLLTGSTLIYKQNVINEQAMDIKSLESVEKKALYDDGNIKTLQAQVSALIRSLETKTNEASINRINGNLDRIQKKIRRERSNIKKLRQMVEEKKGKGDGSVAIVSSFMLLSQITGIAVPSIQLMFVLFTALSIEASTHFASHVIGRRMPSWGAHEGDDVSDGYAAVSGEVIVGDIDAKGRRYMKIIELLNGYFIIYKDFSINRYVSHLKGGLLHVKNSYGIKAVRDERRAMDTILQFCANGSLPLKNDGKSIVKIIKENKDVRAE